MTIRSEINKGWLNEQRSCDDGTEVNHPSKQYKVSNSKKRELGSYTKKDKKAPSA